LLRQGKILEINSNDALVPFVGAIVGREKEMIETALAESRGRIAGPAAKLGIPRQTLEAKSRAWELTSISSKLAKPTKARRTS